MTQKPIEVVILTGFLGAGKTTLMEGWLKGPDWRNTAVIVNELGAVGIDQHLLDGAVQGVVLLENGCICCTIQDDLVGQIHQMLSQRARGEIQPFDRIVIETTGIADPVPVLYTFLSDPILASCFSCPSVVTVVDAMTCDRLVARQPVFLRQVACADVLITTRKDKLDAAAQEQVVARLGQHTVAPILTSSLEDPVAAKEAFDLARVSGRDMQSWQRPAPSGHHHRSHSHGPSSFAFQSDAAQTSQDVNAWVSHLLKSYGACLLRMKGVFDISDENRTVLLQAVGQAFDPPREITLDQTGTNVVVILEEQPVGFHADDLFLHLTSTREPVLA
jgi:G3E family GTPase